MRDNKDDDQTEANESGVKASKGFAALMADGRKRVAVIVAVVAVVALAVGLGVAGASGVFKGRSEQPAVRPVPSEMANGGSSDDANGTSSKDSEKSGQKSDDKSGKATDGSFDGEVGDVAPSEPTTDGSTVDFSTGKPVTSDSNKSGSDSSDGGTSGDQSGSLAPATPLK